jgi:hypothetical protein
LLPIYKKIVAGSPHIFITNYLQINGMINNKVKAMICLGIMVMVFLSTYSITQQIALAQQKQTSAGNVTAQVVPQGTSLQVANKTSTSASPTGTTTSSGNITAPVVPQGTSLNASNATTTTNTTSSR